MGRAAVAKTIKQGQKPAVAGILKDLRQRSGLTLSELALQSSVATSTISKIEAGQLSPGYEIIVKLAHGLNVDVSELFRPKSASVPSGRRSITRLGGGIIHDTDGYVYEALANEVARKEFIPLRVRVKARERFDWEELPAHEGEEFIFVMSGSLRLFTEHYEPLDLDAGDSVYFDSRAGHALISTSDEDADILWICSHREAIERVQTLKDGRP